LGEHHEDSRAQVNVVLSQLRKGEYLSVEPDPQDARRKIYRLISPETVIRQQLLPITEALENGKDEEEEEPKLTRSELEAPSKKGGRSHSHQGGLQLHSSSPFLQAYL